MIKKICPHCGKDSYSSHNNPDWQCPYCGKYIKRTFGEGPSKRKKNHDSYMNFIPLVKDKTRK
ncbi:MAG: hypothetical protein QHH10_08670 [Peptococcaceae bacterium]|jgi:hypothetical protein|nr:hypothetical protein [Peptococcaceae bacterium]MDH7525369.1 hypothetical protein [Peptococcaceae bacterium]